MLDYKTNSLAEGTPEEIVEADYRLQRLVYALACFRAGVDEVEVVYHFLERPDAVVSTTFARADVPALEAELSAAIGRIRAGEFVPTPSEFNCAGCPALDVVCAGTRLRSPAAGTRGGLMRVAVLCDVHGNLPALEAVLAEVRSLEVDRIVCGGDVVAGPFPQECLDRLREIERGVRPRQRRPRVAARARRHVGVALGAARRACPRAPPDAGLSVSLDGVLYCHGSPRDLDEILTKVSPEERFRAALAGVQERVVVGGHTHVQFSARSTGSASPTPAASACRTRVGRVRSGRSRWHRGRAPAHAVRSRRRCGCDPHDELPGADSSAGWLLEPEDPDETSAYFESVAT